MWTNVRRRLRLRYRPYAGDRFGQCLGEGAVRVPAEPGDLLLGFPKEAGGGFGRQLRREGDEAIQDGPKGLWVTLGEESHEFSPRQ